MCMSLYTCVHVVMYMLIEFFILYYYLDIDECNTGDHNCKSNERCVNKPGGFICKCAGGFISVGNTCQGIMYISCSCIASYLHTLLHIDINECNEGSRCDQLCINTNGSYYCSCNEGYSLKDDGKSCKGIQTNIYVIIIQCKKQLF